MIQSRSGVYKQNENSVRRIISLPYDDSPAEGWAQAERQGNCRLLRHLVTLVQIETS